MNETERDRRLAMYCDLTPGQYDDLEGAVMDGLKTMNGARHRVMSELIDDELRATFYGHLVFSHCQTVLSDEWRRRDYEVEFEITVTSAASLMRKMRLFNGWDSVRPVHMKLLYGLFADPWMSYGWIVRVYGVRTLDELCEHGWINGERKKCGHFIILPRGREVLELLGAKISDGGEGGNFGP